MSLGDPPALLSLENTIKTILPEEYQDNYHDVQPVSMGSAILKYAPDGKIAWGEIWQSFCDLAMAGGPPHKGTLLEPAMRSEIEAQPEQYQQAVAEICRGVKMVTGLDAEEGAVPGWIRVPCETDGMAGWLVRAIVMENVSTYSEASSLYLPAGPNYRKEKEIKNVVTSIAKTTHYWTGHMLSAQQREIENLFIKLESQSPLIQVQFPDRDSPSAEYEGLRTQVGERISSKTGLPVSKTQYAAWLGVGCPSVRSAVWMTRAIVASNVLARREGTEVFVPVNSVSDPHGDIVADTVTRIHQFARIRKVLTS